MAPTLARPLQYVFRTIGALHSFRPKLGSVKYIVHCHVATLLEDDSLKGKSFFFIFAEPLPPILGNRGTLFMCKLQHFAKCDKTA